MELSDNIKRQLALLAEDFTRQLPGRLRELEIELTIIKNSSDTRDMKNFRLMVHKLAGSAATFGHDRLSDKAKEFELYLDDFIEKPKFPNGDEWERIEWYLDYLNQEGEDGSAVEELQELYEPEAVEQEEGRKNTVEAYDKNLYLYGLPEDLKLQLTRQLGFYGYTVNSVENFHEIEGLLCASRPAIIFIYTEVFSKQPDMEEILRGYYSDNPEACYIIFLSDEDNFDLRLKAIRSGGDAFFVLPLDIGRLTDKLDALQAKNEDKPYHVLIVDDDQEQVAYYALILQQAGMITSVASDPMKVLSILVESKPDLILMDIYMPGCNGVELTRLLRQHEAFITMPIVYLTFEKSRDKQLEAIKQGGDDFLAKPIQAENLVAIVKLRVERYRSLRYFMERDSLTGLLNHSNLKEQLTREVIRCERTEMPLSFAMIDADHFKLVNDTYGHLTGDRVLKSLARILQDRLRRTDIIGRYGGEEFGVILLNTDADQAFTIMDEIRDNFSRVIHHAEKETFQVTFSCGIASYPEVTTPGELSGGADEAMYAAKESGRNRVMHLKTVD